MTVVRIKRQTSRGRWDATLPADITLVREFLVQLKEDSTRRRFSDDEENEISPWISMKARQDKKVTETLSRLSEEYFERRYFRCRIPFVSGAEPRESPRWAFLLAKAFEHLDKTAIQAAIFHVAGPIPAHQRISIAEDLANRVPGTEAWSFTNKENLRNVLIEIMLFSDEPLMEWPDE